MNESNPLPATASVIICAFADEREQLTTESVRAVLEQQPRPSEVLVVVDHNPRLELIFRERFAADCTVLSNDGEPGLSAARNTAIKRATGDVIVFLDDDAKPRPGWLGGLLAGFSETRILGVGGSASPRWEAREQPGWFPDAFLWVVGCSYAGQPKSGEVRNPLGCNMAFRREVFEAAGLFDVSIGRLGSRPLGCEETELCIRAAMTVPDARFRLVPDAPIDHWVPLVRTTPKYVLRRCFYEGISKALVRTLGDSRSLDTERVYAKEILPGEIRRGVVTAVCGPHRRSGLGRAATVMAGLASAAAGFVIGSVIFRKRGPTSSSSPAVELHQQGPGLR